MHTEPPAKFQSSSSFHHARNTVPSSTCDSGVVRAGAVARGNTFEMEGQETVLEPCRLTAASHAQAEPEVPAP